jgi:hypothetical protein
MFSSRRGTNATNRPAISRLWTVQAGAREMMPLEAAMKTQGEMEAAISEGMNRFEQEYMGRGPKFVHAHLVGDLLVVRLEGVLTAAEQQLVKSLPSEKEETCSNKYAPI